MASEKQVGASAGFLALMAFVVHMFMPPSSEVGNPAAANKPAAEGQSESKRPAADAGKPVPVQGPWLASRQYFHREAPDDFRSPCIDFLLPPGKMKRADQEMKTACDPTALDKLFGLTEDFQNVELTTLIATIPDPLHTQLSLETDRDLDSIQEGAFDDHWEMATQWLPWTAKASQPTEDVKNSTGTPLDLENLPGLIVFRHHFSEPADSNKLLFVFLAGETPTAGINGFQFDAARRCVEILQKRWKPVSILGPSFSGSFMSLTKLIEGDLTKHPYAIQAGHVSNSGYAASMLDQLAHLSVTFHGNTVPTDSFKERFRELAGQEHFNDAQIGELVEDGSGYSFGIFNGTTADKWQTYRYPRDIAQLRNAYSDRAFSAPAASGSAPAPAVPLLLKDAQSGESDFPIFSTSHTPVSQDAVVEQIVHTLKRKKVRLLSVSATNVFDNLFLVKLLAKECPDLRVVLNGADLLFAQEAADNSLSGTLAISSFPMFQEGSDWANGGHRATTFPDSDSIGQYNAMLQLLGGKLESPVAFGPAFQTLPAFSSDWLLVLGRSGWAPVDLLRQENPSITGKNGGTLWFDPQRAPVLRLEENSLPAPRQNVGWVILCLLMSCLSFGLCGRFIYLRWRPKLRTWSMFCSSDLSQPGGISPLAQARYLCLFACLSSLLFLNGLLLVPMLAHPAIGWPQQGLLAMAIISLLGVGGFLAYRIPSTKRMKPQPKSSKVMQGSDIFWWLRKRERVAILRLYSSLYGTLLIRSTLLLLPLFGILFWVSLCYQPGARGMFFRFRVLSLVFPVCPIWPLLFGGAAVFVLSLLNLRRLTWAERQKPSLETSILGPLLEERMKKSEHEMARVFSGPAGTPFWDRLAGVAASCIFIVLLVSLLPEQSFRSFENIRYETLLTALLLPVGILVMRSFTRFVFGWRFLRDLLAVLNSVDLYRFFGRLPDFDGSGPVWSRDLKVLSLATSVNSYIALHNVDLEMPSLAIRPENYWEAWSKYDSPVPRERQQVLQQYREFLNEGKRVSKDIFQSVLVPFWQSKPLPLIQTSAAQVTSASESKEEKIAGAARASFTSRMLAQVRDSSQVSEGAYEMAARYVTQQYAIFISYALRQIQNLLLCSVLAFVLLVLGLNSFCFQAPQLISYLTMVSLAAGIVIVVGILAQIERHPLISRLCGTEEGALGKDFYINVLTYGALPVITVLGTQFPSIARLLGSWAEPALAALK